MKKVLFISYANENSDKVRFIIKELANHPLFEPLVVAFKREPNKALVKKVTEGIDSAYRFIPILTIQSIRTQWINQEIGYAFCKDIPIVPIVENSILSDLKGFIHKQNDCPYTFIGRIRPYKSSENKSFMTCFKLLIKDLEEEIQKDKKEIIREANKSITSQRWYLK